MVPQNQIVNITNNRGVLFYNMDTGLARNMDQVADGVHMDVSATPLGWVGRKAVARSLSDVAAMAAVPVGGGGGGMPAA